MVPRRGIYSQQNELGLEDSGEGGQQNPEGGEGPPEETREMQHIHSPFLFVNMGYPQFSYHHTTKLRACFLAALTSWKLREIIKVFLLQVIPGQLLILWR